MVVDEAKEYLLDMCDLIGTTAVDYLTTKDADKMREAISVLSDGKPIYKEGDLVDTVFGAALVLGDDVMHGGEFLYVRYLWWTPEQIEEMGGMDQAWMCISSGQVTGLKERRPK